DRARRWAHSGPAPSLRIAYRSGAQVRESSPARYCTASPSARSLAARAASAPRPKPRPPKTRWRFSFVVSATRHLCRGVLLVLFLAAVQPQVVRHPHQPPIRPLILAPQVRNQPRRVLRLRKRLLQRDRDRSIDLLLNLCVAGTGGHGWLCDRR